MPTSFICEHTAEFVLVPNLISILKHKFNRIIPLYFWISREGSKISRKCDENSQIRVIAMFARRPKVKQSHQPSILVKFNKELFSYAKRHENHGIPVLVGVPCVSSIMDFQLGVKCLWFEIIGHEDQKLDLEYVIALSQDKFHERSCQTGINGPLRAEHILELAKKSQPMNWDKLIDSITFIKHSCNYGSWFRGTGYKPVYFLLLENTY